MVVNVPLDDRLDGIDPEGADAAGAREDYVARWTAGNHARVATGLAAAAACTIALSH